MTKHALLEHLADIESADAIDVADTFGITYAAAAMALLRLSRQGLVHHGGFSGSTCVHWHFD